MTAIRKLFKLNRFNDASLFNPKVILDLEILNYSNRTTFEGDSLSITYRTQHVCRKALPVKRSVMDHNLWQITT